MARSDLLSVLRPEHGFDPGIYTQVRATHFTTAPYSALYEGLCRRDSLELRFAAVSVDGKPEDRPLKPYGIETTPWFADAGLAASPTQAKQVFSPACEALNEQSPRAWFTATDAQQAAEAILLDRTIRNELRAGTLKVSVRS